MIYTLEQINNMVHGPGRNAHTRPSQFMRTLKTKRDWLEKRVAESRNPDHKNSMEEEIVALEWAIPILEAYRRSHNQQEPEYFI